MKPLLIFTLLFFCIRFFSNAAVFAAEQAFSVDSAPLSLEIEQLDADTLYDLTDGDYYTFYTFDRVDLTVIPEKPSAVLYIIWNEPPAEYTVKANGNEITINSGFMHQLITLSEPSEWVGITCSEGGEICDIYMFSDGDGLPEYVQAWREPCNRADMLVFSAHADDELLMFGGTLPYYANELDLRVQVVYMTTHWQEQPRPHEMLDGLWTAGVENYPVLGIIPDIPYQPIFTLSEAAELYDFEEISKWFIEQIRRFKPSVIVTHDLKGEYGHAAHKLAAKTASEAVELSYDPTVYPESAEKYGVWDVPKIYLHFYPENAIEMDWERPLESYGGMTAREAAALCYDKHKSQHVWGYSVNYGENWDCRQFGLYRSLVGADTKADFMDNIAPLPKEELTETTAEETAESQETKETEEKPKEESAQVPPKTEVPTDEAARETVGTTASPSDGIFNDYGLAITIAAVGIVLIAVIIIFAVKKRR